MDARNGKSLSERQFLRAELTSLKIALMRSILHGLESLCQVVTVEKVFRNCPQSPNLANEKRKA